MAGRIVIACAGLLLTAAAPVQRQSVESLGWIAGGWGVEQADGSWTEELWMAPRGGMIAGIGRAGKGASAISFELMRIAPDANGVLTYYASPDGAGPFAFTLKESGPTSFVAERGGTEFPLRVRYSRDGATLSATISGPGEQSMSWTYTRRP